MAWTATLLRKDDNGGSIDFVVEFTNGVNILVEQFRSQGKISADDIKRQVKTRLAQLENLSTLDIPLGEKDFIETVKSPPPVKDPPTQLVIDLTAYRRKMSQLRTMEELVTIGAILDSHATVVALRAAMITDYQEAFLPLMGVS